MFSHIFSKFHAKKQFISACAILLGSTVTFSWSELTAADITLTGAGAQSWGVANDTVNITLDTSNKFTGTFTLTDGTAKLVSNYGANTFGGGSNFVLGNGTTLDINGATVSPLAISTTGATTITSSKQNTQNGLGTITMGGILTITTPNRYCIEGAVNGGGYEIYKTGSNEMVVKNNITNLKALHIQQGTWSVESNVTGFGDGDIYLEGGTMKLWGANRSVSFNTLYYRSGQVRLYSDGKGPQALTGDIVLEADNADFKVSSTLTYTGSISGADYTLKHSAEVTEAVNHGGYPGPQTGNWIFKGESVDNRGVTTLKNFHLTTKDSIITLDDYADWVISGTIDGKSTGHELSVGANATLDAGTVSGIKKLTIAGATQIDTLNMSQADGVLIVDTATTLGAVNFSQNTTVTTNAKLTTGATAINSGVTVVKDGGHTLEIGGNLTGEGTLKVTGGMLTQTVGENRFNSFKGQIILGNGATLDLNSQQAYSCPAIICQDGSAVVNTNETSNAVYWNGVNLDVEAGATVELGGTKRFAVAFKNGTANGGTLNVTNNNYIFLSTKLENATVNVSGFLGIEGATTLTSSEGKELYLNLQDGGRITSWTGGSTYTLRPTATTVNNGTFAPQGNLVLENDVTLNGNMAVSVGKVSDGTLSTFQFNGNVAGDHVVNTSGAGTVTFNGGVDVKEVNLGNGNVVIGGGTFSADKFTVGATTILIQDGEMRLGGTVMDTDTSVYQVSGGALTLGDGVTLNGKIEFSSDAVMNIGLDSTRAAEVRLLSSENELSGTIVFDIFSNESFDQLFLGDNSTVNDLAIMLNVNGADSDYTEILPIISGLNLDISATMLTSGWALEMANGTLYARNTSAVPEPTTWVLLGMSLFGINWLRTRKKVA